MKITVEQLRTMVKEAVSQKLAENKEILSEGIKEIPIRMVLGDIKDIIVDSITEDLTAELKMDEKTIILVVSRAFDKMVKEIVLELDKPEMAGAGLLPRRRVVPVGA